MQLRRFGFLILLLVILFVLNVFLGSVSISAGTILEIITDPDHRYYPIVWKIRVPGALVALVSGVALSVAGLLMQTLFKNPLAGPSVLGISSGASLGVALLTLVPGFSALMIPFVGNVESWMMILMAIVGASLIAVLLLGISLRVRHNITLLIIGLMLGYVTSAVVSIWQFYSHPGSLKDFILWTFGSFDGIFGQKLLVLILIVLSGTLLSLGLIRSLNMLLLGEQYAQTMGLDIKKNRVIIILITSILVGSVTAFCGPIAFVGIAAPHVARVIFKTALHQYLIPGSALVGAALLLFCELVVHVSGSWGSLPINVITSLLGAPIVIAIVIRSKRLQNSL